VTKTSAAVKTSNDPGMEVRWTLEIGLRGGHNLQFQIPVTEKDRLTHVLANSGDRFFQFASDALVVCLNRRHAVYLRIMFDMGIFPEQEELDNPYGMDVWFAGQREPFSIEVDEDRIVDGDDMGQLASVLFYLEQETEREFLSFLDEDGEAVYLRVEDIALMTIPSDLVKHSPEEVDEDSDGEVIQ
jgi:hypothetical protein